MAHFFLLGNGQPVFEGQKETLGTKGTLKMGARRNKDFLRLEKKRLQRHGHEAPSLSSAELPFCLFVGEKSPNGFPKLVFRFPRSLDRFLTSRPVPFVSGFCWFSGVSILHTH